MVCPIAAIAPTNMDAMDKNAIICIQSLTTNPNPSNNKRVKRPIAASFGAVAKNAVTAVGAPS